MKALFLKSLRSYRPALVGALCGMLLAVLIGGLGLVVVSYYTNSFIFAQSFSHMVSQEGVVQATKTIGAAIEISRTQSQLNIVSLIELDSDLSILNKWLSFIAKEFPKGFVKPLKHQQDLISLQERLHSSILHVLNQKNVQIINCNADCVSSEAFYMIQLRSQIYTSLICLQKDIVELLSQDKESKESTIHSFLSWIASFSVVSILGGMGGAELLARLC